MNYLQLGQELHREARYAGGVPTTLQNQTGQNLDVAQWTKNAWQDIQLMFDGRWKFHWRTFTFDTVIGDDTYAFGDANDVIDAAPIARFHAWELNNIRQPAKIYLTSAGKGTEQWLIWTEWENFEQVYKIGTQNDAMPVYITIDPQDNIVLGPAPNGVYTITGNYWRSPQDLVLDDDVPECPPQFHRAISFHALAKYGYANVAQEAIMRANVEGTTLLNALLKNQGATRKRFKRAAPMA